MNAIQIQLQINRVTIQKDDSVSFSASTPALTDTELAAFRSMSKLLVNALLEPQSGSSTVLAIKETVGGKSPSNRLRSVLFLLWKQTGEPQNDFDTYYRIKMEGIIDAIKVLLE
jgi:hypothetical protein